MLRWVKRTIALLAALGIVVLVVMAMIPKPVLVEVGKASRGPLQVTVDEDGQTRVRQRYMITAPVAGHLGRIELRAGDDVDVGHMLARVAPTTSPLLDRRAREQMEGQVRAASAAVRRAEAMAEGVRLAQEQANRELARTRALVKSGALSDQTLEEADLQTRGLEKESDAAKLGFRIAQHELEMARAALRGADGSAESADQLEIRAPVRGTVLRVHVESAGVVGPGTPLLEIGDLSSLEVVVDLLTSDAVNVKPGNVVRLERWGGSEPLDGRVRRVEPSAFTKVSALGVEEQRVWVVIDPIDAKTWRGLGDGYRVEASIVIWSHDDVLKVPASAAFRHAGGWGVFTIEGERAVTRTVEIGRRTGLEVEIKSGIDENATVVLHPSDEIQDGVLVEAK